MLHNKSFFKKSGRETNVENVLKVNMHLLLHPSAWSDRADDEAENDILAMQVDRSQMQVHSRVPDWDSQYRAESSIQACHTSAMRTS